MQNKLKIIGYAVIIIIIFYTVIYGMRPNKIKTNMLVSSNLQSDELVSTLSDNMDTPSGESPESGDFIVDTLSVSTIDKQENVSNYNNSGNVKPTSNTTYYIKVNNLQNVVTIYKKDSNGNYTVPYKAMICSTGTATPAAGKMYKITTYKKRWNGLQGNVYGQYATQIIGNILFHSVPYTSKNNSSLEYWEYDKLGTAASLGCIRLTVADAKWIYDNISSGTIVEFYEDNNPGPLGKPAAQKISDNERCRGWDPTDLAKGNPWNTAESTDDINSIIQLESENKMEEVINVIDILETMPAISGENVQSGDEG